MKFYYLPIVFLFIALQGHAQDWKSPLENGSGLRKAVTPADSVLLSNLPELTLADADLTLVLPDQVDNSVHPYLRPVFDQDGASCGQAAAVGYHFTYEIDRIRNVPADVPANQYPTHFTWNFMNYGYYEGNLFGVGVSYYHSFEIIKRLGCPNVQDYGGMWKRGDTTRWMNGYDTYYNSMKNRIDQLYSIDVSHPDGLTVLKHWLYDHLEGSPVGGVANFYAGIIFPYELPQGTPEAGKPVILNWYDEATHAMTIVGYNDSIRFDYNDDGRYTNDEDINSDGIVNMRDWEIGGLKFVNSYSEDWGDNGFCYMMYHTLAEFYGNGGIWNNTVNVLRLKEPYSPLLTMKIKLVHTSRGKIKVSAGIAPDTSLQFPVETIEFPVFNFQGGDIFMQGGWDEEDKTIEFGLDITPLLSYAEPEKPYRIFLVVDEKDPLHEASGEVAGFSVIDYSNSVHETECPYSYVPLNENDRTLLSVTLPGISGKITIDDELLPVMEPGIPYSHQLTATGGTPPYSWSYGQDYLHQPAEGSFPFDEGQKLIPNHNDNGYAMVIPEFSFPFFGETYDTLYIQTGGSVLFTNEDCFYPYVQDLGLHLATKRAIAPMTGEALVITTNSADGIWYEGSPDSALIRWRLSDREHPTATEFNFALKLYPDGSFQFHYDSMAFSEPPEWVAGFSSGNSKDYRVTGSSTYQNPVTLIPERFVPVPWPEGFTLTPEGLLQGIPGNFSRIYEVRITATDYNRISDTRRIQLTPSLLVTPRVDAGPDGTIGRDETFTIDLEVMNHSTVPVEDVRIEADLNDAFVTLTPHSSTLSGLQPGETRLVSAAMTMHTGEDIPDEHEFRCNLSLITSSDTLLKDIGLKAVASRLRFGGITVVDGNNQWLDPGENAILELKLNNLGHDRATGVSVRIICTDPYLSVNQSTLLDYAEIPPQNSGSGSLNVTANPVSPEGHLVPVTIEINQDLGAPVTETFILQIGRTPILVIDLDENLSSGPVIQQSINGLGIAADLVTPIPWWELHKYRAIFLCLGVFPFNHELTAEEGDHFATYLLEGGNLYMEGSTTWFLDDHTALHDLLHIQGKNQGWISGIDTLVGEAAAWTSDLSFAYTGEHTRMDNLIPVEPAYPLFSEKTSGYDYTVAFDAVNYRSIGASYEFAGLDGLGSASALMLMDRYLQFFGMESSGLAANFLADTVSILTHQQVQFTDLSTSTAVMWQWSFPGGSPSSSTEIDPVVVYDSAGVFDVSLTVTDGTGANTLVKRNYITVVSGTGIADLHSEEVLRIYPNPTAGLFWLESPLNSGEVQVTILNQTGRRVIERLLKVPGNGIVTLDVHWLPSGVYLVRLTDDKACHTEKLIILH